MHLLNGEKYAGKEMCNRKLLLLYLCKNEKKKGDIQI